VFACGCRKKHILRYHMQGSIGHSGSFHSHCTGTKKCFVSYCALLLKEFEWIVTYANPGPHDNLPFLRFRWLVLAISYSIFVRGVWVLTMLALCIGYANEQADVSESLPNALLNACNTGTGTEARRDQVMKIAFPLYVISEKIGKDRVAA
jgi:hypothetical protein